MKSTMRARNNMHNATIAPNWMTMVYIFQYASSSGIFINASLMRKCAVDKGDESKRNGMILPGMAAIFAPGKRAHEVHNARQEQHAQCHNCAQLDDDGVHLHPVGRN